MKLKLKLFILTIAGIAVIYSACKKSDSSSGPALSEKDVSSQIALDLSQNLFGSYSGLNLSGGFGGVSGFAAKHMPNSHQLHDLSNPFCGLVVDTAINDTEKIGVDSTITLSGHIKFSFTCSGDNLSGFSTNDNLSVAVTTPQFSLISQIAENITMNALNPADENTQFSLSGNISSTGTYAYKTSAGKSGTRSFSYVLNALTLDPNSDDIISGTATFSTKGSGKSGTWSYSGTIKFLGNHTAQITINSKSYTVNLETGVVAG